MMLIRKDLPRSGCRCALAAEECQASRRGRRVNWKSQKEVSRRGHKPKEEKRNSVHDPDGRAGLRTHGPRCSKAMLPQRSHPADDAFAQIEDRY